MNTLENLVWELKFRPKLVKDTILPKTTKNMITDIMKSGNIPNMLFAGTSGTGKTTLATAMADELGADFLYINASLEGNMDTLRTTITQFVSSVSFTESKKIVLLDECDHLTNAVQPALRGFLDMFSSNAIFIFTCNYKSKIIDALISRLTVIDFRFEKEERQDAMGQMLKRSRQILDSESIKYDKMAVGSVVLKNFPDFRKTLVELQRYSSSGEIDSGILAKSQDSDIDALVEDIKTKNFAKARQWVANSSMDATGFYRGLYDSLLPKLAVQSIPPVILCLAESQYRASQAVDQEIAQIACIIQLMTTCNFK